MFASDSIILSDPPLSTPKIKLLFALFFSLIFAFEQASSGSCLLLKTAPERSPFFLTLVSIFSMVKSLIVTFFCSTSSHSSGAETVAPGFGLTEYGATTDFP